MGEKKLCIVCGKPTSKVLFKDAALGIHVCSWKCEQEYLASLRGKKEEQQILLRYWNQKMARNKKYIHIGWVSTAVGFAVVALGFFLTRLSATKDLQVGAYFFVVGAFIITCSALLTRHLDHREWKLQEKRKRVI
jgi:hypothetical protein